MIRVVVKDYSTMVGGRPSERLIPLGDTCELELELDDGTRLAIDQAVGSGPGIELGLVGLFLRSKSGPLVVLPQVSNAVELLVRPEPRAEFAVMERKDRFGRTWRVVEPE